MTNNQRKETFSEVKQRVTREQFVKVLQEQGREATIDLFELGLTNFMSLVHFYECENILEEWKQKRRKAAYEAKAQEKLKLLCDKAPKSNFIDYYITQNHSITETQTYFCLSESEAFQLVNHYGCKKPKTLSKIHSQKTKEVLYGDKNYNNREQAIKTCLDKYGVSNPSQVLNFVESAQETKIAKYGLENSNNWKQGQETRIVNSGSLEESYRITTQHRQEYCLTNYGVDNMSKVGFVKDKIKESTKNTFQDKYGVDCYWLLPDAKRSSGSKDSSYNQAFEQLLINNNVTYKREVSVGNFIYDFQVGNYLIEINPSPTHNITWSPYNSTKGIDVAYHKSKSENALKYDYRCIHVWDWDNCQKLITQLLVPKEKIYARQCVVQDVSPQDAKLFIDEHHLQGYARDSIRLGLYYKNKLVSIMTFGKPRYNLSAQYELIRYCSCKTVVGGAEKLFKNFIATYCPTSIVSYCDTAKFAGNVYPKLGFEYKTTTLSHHWYNMKTKQHHLDSLVRKRGFDQLFGTNFGKGTSNYDLMLQHGFVEIVDSGQSTYIWKAN